MRQYKDLLDRDGWYNPHPLNDDRVFVDEDRWIESVQVHRQDGDITKQRYQDLVTDYGVESFKQRYDELQETDPTSDRGVQ